MSLIQPQGNLLEISLIQTKYSRLQKEENNRIIPNPLALMLTHSHDACDWTWVQKAVHFPLITVNPSKH
jgi:hypothetical protein